MEQYLSLSSAHLFKLTGTIFVSFQCTSPTLCRMIALNAARSRERILRKWLNSCTETSLKNGSSFRRSTTQTTHTTRNTRAGWRTPAPRAPHTFTGRGHTYWSSRYTVTSRGTGRAWPIAAVPSLCLLVSCNPSCHERTETEHAIKKFVGWHKNKYTFHLLIFVLGLIHFMFNYSDNVVLNDRKTTEYNIQKDMGEKGGICL